MLKKILLAFDGGTASFDALNKAIELTQANHAELIVMSVVNTTDLPVNFGMSFNPGLSTDLKNDSEVDLRTAKKILKTKHLNYHARLMYGEPSVIILNYAKNKHVDLIIMGKPTASGIERLFSNSVTRYVSKRTAINTMIVA